MDFAVVLVVVVLVPVVPVVDEAAGGVVAAGGVAAGPVLDGGAGGAGVRPPLCVLGVPWAGGAIGRGVEGTEPSAPTGGAMPEATDAGAGARAAAAAGVVLAGSDCVANAAYVPIAIPATSATANTVYCTSRGVTGRASRSP